MNDDCFLFRSSGFFLIVINHVFHWRRMPPPGAVGRNVLANYCELVSTIAFGAFLMALDRKLIALVSCGTINDIPGCDLPLETALNGLISKA